MSRTDKLADLKKQKQEDPSNNRYSDFRKEFKDIFEDMV